MECKTLEKVFEGVLGTYEIDRFMETNRQITPEWIETLRENEIFVFGCRNSGRHIEWTHEPCVPTLRRILSEFAFLLRKNSLYAYLSENPIIKSPDRDTFNYRKKVLANNFVHL